VPRPWRHRSTGHCKKNLPGDRKQTRARTARIRRLRLRRLLSRLRPAQAIEARHTVGMVDAISAADLAEPVNDGLPETLEDVVGAYGHRYFKLKVGVRWMPTSRGSPPSPRCSTAPPPPITPRWTATSNMTMRRRCRTAGPQSTTPGAAPAVRLHPVHRTARSNRQGRAATGHLAAEPIPPVIIDESDGGAAPFEVARERGYTGCPPRPARTVQVGAQRRALRDVERRTGARRAISFPPKT